MRTLEAWLILLVLALAPLNPYHLALGAWGRGGDPYVYYGYAPPTVINYTSLVDQTLVANYSHLPARLDIIGINESTSVQVYNLTGNTLIASKTINRMELWTLYLGTAARNLTIVPSGGDVYFKVVSEKPVAALLSGGELALRHMWLHELWILRDERAASLGFNTFYPSTDGGFIGGEFIFMTTPTWWAPERYVGETYVYFIFGIDGSHVAVYNTSGARVTELDVSPYSFTKISSGTMRSGKVYRVTSTGRIMVAGLSVDTFFQLPALTGGFVGRGFMGTASAHTHVQSLLSWIVVANEDADIKVFDLLKPLVMGAEAETHLAAGEEWSVTTLKSHNKPLLFQSTGDITVFVGMGGIGWGGNEPASVERRYIGDDISVFGARAGETLGFYTPATAVIFAPEDLECEIDGTPVEMRRDEWQIVLAGRHTVRANAPIIVEITGDANAWGDGLYFGFDDWGTYLLSVQGLELEYPAPPSRGGLPIIPIVGGAAAVIIVVAVILIFKRRGRAGAQAE